jgi:hypothetical protein
MRKHARELLESLNQAIAHARGEHPKGVRVAVVNVPTGKVAGSKKRARNLLHGLKTVLAYVDGRAMPPGTKTVTVRARRMKTIRKQRKK